ncbi:hypothetical protein M8818_004192 [Zalaria obscura]|uniref:Uncharacterized protein n=1 Tax=Zalaria obscura TaxID=2024903 RepID=A0ACC3SDG5_9PEZI
MDPSEEVSAQRLVDWWYHNLPEDDPCRARLLKDYQACVARGAHNLDKLAAWIKFVAAVFRVSLVSHDTDIMLMRNKYEPYPQHFRRGQLEDSAIPQILQTPSKGVGLADLPPELLDEIFVYLLLGTNVKYLDPAGETRYKYAFQTPILRSNKYIGACARRFLYSKNKLVMIFHNAAVDSYLPQAIDNAVAIVSGMNGEGQAAWVPYDGKPPLL